MLLSGFAILLGCLGGGGGGGGGGSGSSVTLSLITGTLDVSALSAATTDLTTSTRVSAAWDFSSTLVFLEENPLYSARPDTQGRFVIEQVPPGTYHLIARLSSTLMPSYKVRLGDAIQVTAGASPPFTKIVVTEEDRADSQITILVVNPYGLPIPGVKVSLWGELFTSQGNGIFLSPLMPAKAAGSILIEPPFDSGLEKYTLTIQNGTFIRYESPALGVTLIPSGVINRPPNVWMKADKTEVTGDEEVRIISTAQDPDFDELIPSWTAAVGTFPEAGISQAIWQAPSNATSVTIVFAVTEKTTKIPNFTSKTRIVITVATSTSASGTGPVGGATFSLDITGTATIQIPGNMIARYDAVATGTITATPTFSWTVSNGTIVSGQNSSSLFWKSPPLQTQAQQQVASISVTAGDGVTQLTRTITPAIVAAPNVEIISPTESILRKGAIEFVGQSTDFDGGAIAVSEYKWYVGTDSFNPRLQSTGQTRFTYNFTDYRNFRILLSTKNSRGVTATTTKSISIVNTPPVCQILLPADNTAFEIGTNISFVASAADYEDLYIADNRAEWHSSISGTFSTKLTTSAANLASGQHLITLMVRDAKGLSSTATVSIIITNLPLMKFTPAAGATFFAATPIQFIGNGTDSKNVAITPENMRWSLNGTAWQTGVSSFVIVPGDLPSGTHVVKLEGTDALGKTGSTQQSFQVGIASPGITFPASGTSFDVGDQVYCTASPTSVGSISFLWYANRGTPQEVIFGRDSPARISSLTWGRHTLTYLATDSQNFTGSAEIMILLNATTTLLATPTNNSVFFGGQNLTFIGSGTEADGTPLNTAEMKWYLDSTASVWKTGNTFTAAPAELPSGPRVITFTAADQFGTVSTLTRNITVGYALPDISSPSAWASYSINLPLNFQATPNSVGPLTMVWWASRTTPIQFGTGSSGTYTFPSPSTWTLTYLGTDSQGFLASFSREVFLENFSPTMEFTPAHNSILFSGQNIPFAGAGTESNNITPVPVANLKWFKNGVLWKTATSSFTALPGDPANGVHQISLLGVDSKSLVGEATNTIQVGYSLPAITSPASGAVFAPGAVVPFTGTPDSSGTIIVMTWLADSGIGAFDTSANGSRAFNRGRYYISYLGTDSQNFTPVASIAIVVNSDPVMIASPTSGFIAFLGNSIPFIGSGTDASGTAIPAASMTWYKNGTLDRTGTSSFIAAPASFSGAGAYTFALAGRDDLGFTGTDTQTVYYGYPLANIVSPASNDRFGIGANVPFSGAPDSSGTTVVMTWYRSDDVATTTFGTGQTANDIFAARGRYRVTYSGTDSLDLGSSQTVQIIIDDLPAMDFVPPHNGILFANSTHTFAGNGTDSANIAIPAASMTWRLDGVAWKTGMNSFIVNAGDLTAGNRTIRLEGTDDLGIVGSVSHTINYGFANANITSPTDGTRYDEGTTVGFTGSPDSSGPITMTWFRSDGVSTSTMGTGQIAGSLFNTRGKQWITYVGTDSLGIASSKTINILVGAPPTMDFNPPDNGLLFANTTLTFTGNGTDSAGVSIPAASMTWRLNGGVWKTGVNTFVVNPGDIPNGNNSIRLEGMDDQGIVGSVTHAIIYGYTAAGFVSPASGTRFDTGSLVTFTATPAHFLNSATFTWHIDYGAAVLTNSTTYSSAGIASGWHTLTYYGTDSGGNVSSATIGVWINTLPVMGPITVTAPNQYATGPNGVKILTRIGGAGLFFSGSATDFEAGGALPNNALSWFIAGDNATKAIGLPFNWLVSAPASLTIKCVATDSWGFAVSTSTVIWDWDYEQYNNFPAQPGPLNQGTQLNNPTSLQVISTTNLVVADIGNNRLMKLVRDDTGGLTTDGDLTGAATDTANAPNPFPQNLIDISLYLGNIYTLEANDPEVLRTVNPVNFLITGTIAYPVGLDNPTGPVGMARGAGAFYLADTGAARVRRVDSNNGAFFSEQAAVTAPFRLRLDTAGTNLYVTDQTNDLFYRYASDLNPVAKVWEKTVTQATDIALSTNYVLVSDATNNKIHVLQQSNGDFVYEFGHTVDNPLSSPYGLALVTSDNDLYIVERSNPGRITRIRSQGW
jgi:hypothetical protein